MRASIVLRIDKIPKNLVIRNIKETDGTQRLFITWLKEDVTMIFTYEAFEQLFKDASQAFKDGR